MTPEEEAINKIATSLAILASTQEQMGKDLSVMSESMVKWVLLESKFTDMDRKFSSIDGKCEDVEKKVNQIWTIGKATIWLIGSLGGLGSVVALIFFLKH